MIKSMTGVGNARTTNDEFDIEVRVRSVNNRYLDLNLRLPSAFYDFEHPLRQRLQQLLERGKVDLFFEIKDLRHDTVTATLNTQIIDAVLAQTSYLGDLPEIDGGIDAATLLGINGVLSIESRPLEDPDRLLARLGDTAEAAIKDMINMRETEGKNIREDLLKRFSACSEILDGIESQTDKVTEEYLRRLNERVAELTNGLNLDPERLEQEVAILVERSDITEEIVRLRSHLNQALQLLDSDKAVGKKLDFLIQEMNREINTIGAKGRKADMSSSVVEIKSEIEKIREQVQNIE
ncbi:MAG TPA: YicC/YloC family endoribonuclease [Acidobacteriota bacterium]|nr:YicC/YloC family endoribonuclease [Acidobacteriota bacterium]